jgi:hypothetical protein
LFRNFTPKTFIIFHCQSFIRKSSEHKAGLIAVENVSFWIHVAKTIQFLLPYVRSFLGCIWWLSANCFAQNVEKSFEFLKPNIWGFKASEFKWSSCLQSFFLNQRAWNSCVCLSCSTKPLVCNLCLSGKTLIYVSSLSVKHFLLPTVYKCLHCPLKSCELASFPLRTYYRKDTDNFCNTNVFS